MNSAKWQLTVWQLRSIAEIQYYIPYCQRRIQSQTIQIALQHFHTLHTAYNHIRTGIPLSQQQFVVSRCIRKYSIELSRCRKQHKYKEFREDKRTYDRISQWTTMEVATAIVARVQFQTDGWTVPEHRLHSLSTNFWPSKRRWANDLTISWSHNTIFSPRLSSAMSKCTR